MAEIRVRRDGPWPPRENPAFRRRNLFVRLFCVTVVKMRSEESNNFEPDHSAFPIDLNLPEFEAPQLEHWPSKMSWSEAMRMFAATRERYMREFDSPQQRLLDKNPEPFRLP